MNRLVAIVLGATLAFAAVACGGDDDDDDDDAADAAAFDAPPPAPTLDEICAENGGLYVDFFGKMFGCQAGLFELLIGELPTDAELAALCEGALSPFLDDGTTVLGDRDAFDACREFIDGLTCADAAFDVPNPCDDVIVGQVPLDGDCDTNDQCAGDAYCEGGANVAGVRAIRDGALGPRPAPAGTPGCGTCTARLANGQVCNESFECTSGYCKEIEGASSECSRVGDVGDACTSSQDCLGSRVCDPSNLQCADEPTWAAGTPCNTFIFDCGGPAADIMCHPGVGECVAWLEVGETCEGGTNPPAFCRFFEYQTCQDVGGGTLECVAATIVGQGDACGFFAGAKCDTGLVCDDQLEQCVPVVGLDGDCSGTTQCEFLLNCVNDSCSYSSYTGMCPAP